MKNTYRIALLATLVATTIPATGWAQTAQQLLDRRKQSISERHKRDADSLSCTTITHAGPRKACVFWRDIYDEAAKCVRNSLTDKDVTDCNQKLQGDLKAMDMQPESWYDPQNAKWRDDARAAAKDYEETYIKYRSAGSLPAANAAKFDFRGERLWKYRLRLQTDIRNAKDFLTNDEAAAIVDDFKKTKAELVAAVTPAPATTPAPTTTKAPTTTTTPATPAPAAAPAQSQAPLTWKAMPGSAAVDIGAGGGQIWAITSNEGIYRMENGNWAHKPGAAVRVAVDPQGNAWVVNKAGQIYIWNNNAWAQFPGVLSDIAVGANGTVWGVNPQQAIYRLNDDKKGWTRMPGAATRVSVDPQGNAWVVNQQGQIFTWNGTGWTQRPGAALDVAVCGTGEVYVVGTNNIPYKWNGETWIKQTGSGATNIACSAKGQVFVTVTNGAMYASDIH